MHRKPAMHQSITARRVSWRVLAESGHSPSGWLRMYRLSTPVASWRSLPPLGSIGTRKFVLDLQLVLSGSSNFNLQVSHLYT
jgi:hypothetical protein